MFPNPPQPLNLGNVPLGYIPNFQNQIIFQQPGLAQPDLPPLPSPFLLQQITIPAQPPSYKNFNPIANPPHLQHTTSRAPNSKYVSDVDLFTDTSDVENGKENTDEGKGTQKEHSHGWQHVKKRKRLHQSTESSTRINSEISTQNRYTLLLSR